jgi:hypothetical protein
VKRNADGTLRVNDGRLRLHIGDLDAESLRNILEENFHFQISISKTVKTFFALFAFPMDLEKFKQGKRNMSFVYQLIAPYLISAMEYKICDPASGGRAPDPLDKKMQDLLPNKDIFINGKFPWSLHFQSDKFIGDYSSLFLYKGAHKLSFSSGDVCLSLKAQDNLYRYLSLVFAVKEYLKSDASNSFEKDQDFLKEDEDYED